MQNQLSLKIGDVVHLNSGSPDLKVIALRDYDVVVVEWDGESGPEQTEFPSVCLRISN